MAKNAIPALLIDTGACTSEEEARYFCKSGRAYLDANGMLRVQGTGVIIHLNSPELMEQAAALCERGGAHQHNADVFQADVVVQDAGSLSPLDEDPQRTHGQGVTRFRKNEPID